MQLKGRTLLITGGNSGIGFEIAKMACAEGARVFLHGRDASKTHAAADALGSGVVPVTADMSSITDIEQMAAEIRARTPVLDGLVINAGVGPFMSLSDMTEACYDLIMDTNVKGAFFTIRAVRSLLAPSASIVFNGSVVANKGLPGSSVYAASKAALRAMTRALATELAPAGIRVNIVNPGPVDTPILDKQGITGATKLTMQRQFGEATLLQRIARVDEVAAMFLFLLSDKASYVTGSAFDVDGGFAQI